MCLEGCSQECAKPVPTASELKQVNCPQTFYLCGSAVHLHPAGLEPEAYDMIRNQVDMRRFKDALGGMQFNRPRRSNVVPGNMGGCQFVILAERGLTAIVDGFDIPALG
jgi:hypothetical protein